MEFIIGLLSGLSLIGAYELGRRQKSKPQPMTVDEQAQQQAKDLYNDLQAIMNYDVQTAMQRKKVT